MNIYRKSLYLVAVVVSVTVSLYSFPPDDGLRHVGAAFSDFSGWGDVYPFSVFQQFEEYNPWFGYDVVLRGAAHLVSFLPEGSLLAAKVVIVKGLALVFLLLFFYLVLERSGLLKTIKDRDGFTLAVILLVALLFFSIKRMVLIRPFAFGTFYLLYSVGRKGGLKGAISSLILTFFYPYLSWFYILPAAFAHFIRGDRRFAGGATVCILLFLLVQPLSFWGFQVELFRSASVRQTIDLKISEFIPTWRYIFFYIYLAAFVIIFPFLSSSARRLNYTSMLLVIYLYPSMKHVRYFIDILLPLVLVGFGKEMLDFLLTPYKKCIELWKRITSNHLITIRSTLTMRSPTKDIGNRPREIADTNLKPYLAVGYGMLIGLMILTSTKQLSKLRSFQESLVPIPHYSKVLSPFDMQYKTLFLRPDIQMVPSCELGFPTPYISLEYRAFFNKGMVFPVASKTGAGFFLDNRSMYIDPAEGAFLERKFEGDKLTLWRIIEPGEAGEKKGTLRNDGRNRDDSG